METFSNHLCYVILFENHQHGGTHGMTNRLRGYTRQKRLGNTVLDYHRFIIITVMILFLTPESPILPKVSSRLIFATRYIFLNNHCQFIISNVLSYARTQQLQGARSLAQSYASASRPDEGLMSLRLCLCRPDVREKCSSVQHLANRMISFREYGTLIISNI